MTPATKNETDAAILRRICFLCIDSLSPSLTRVDLVNKVKTIWALADPEMREGDLVTAGSSDRHLETRERP